MRFVLAYGFTARRFLPPLRFRLLSALRFGLSPIFAQQHVQPVKDHTHLLDELSIILELFAEARRDGVKSCGIETVKLIVLEVDVTRQTG